MPLEKTYAKNKDEIFTDCNKLITENELVVYVSYRFPYANRVAILDD